MGRPHGVLPGARQQPRPRRLLLRLQRERRPERGQGVGARQRHEQGLGQGLHHQGHQRVVQRGKEEAVDVQL